MTERTIKALAKDVADKIAAGEVVERPLSVVKELLENSIDAGAGAVTIEISGGGKEYIRVTDNGCGIPKDQLELAFTRYATSKIVTETDLENVASLGFRGEALASIASVSVVELISRTASSKTGTKIKLTAGETDSIEDSACEEGSTIIVRELFFNVPARRKFLKPDNAEAALITDFVSKMAIAYPKVRIRLISNGTILFSTTGKGDLYQAILTVYSPQTARALIPVSFKDENRRLSLTGYISQPTQSKKNRKWQIFFVNGRFVKNKILENAVSDAYRDKLFEGNYPVVYLFLELEPSELDVNIHPHKTEIRFYKEDDVYDFAVKALRRALLNPDALNYVPKEDKKQEIKKPEAGILTDISQSVNIKPSTDVEIYRIVKPDTQVNELGSTPASVDFLSVIKEIAEENKNENIPVQEEIFDNKAEITEELPRLFEYSKLIFTGQAFDTYLICKDESHIYFIDQHAAHERVMFEKLLSRFNSEINASQLLLTPAVLDLTPSQNQLAPEIFEELSKTGYSFEEFGPCSYLIKEIPACLDMDEAMDFARAFFEAAEDDKRPLQLKLKEITVKSCKAAVKAHDHISQMEVAALFKDLDSCENPFSCPHGRPVFVRFSEYEIERMFKRK